MRSCDIREQCGNVQPASFLRSDGSLLGMRPCSSNLADVVGDDGIPGPQITSMAQIAPIVFEELFSLASSRLGRFTAEPGVVISSSSSSKI